MIGVINEWLSRDGWAAGIASRIVAADVAAKPRAR
jgi:hypothetical protein